MIYDNLKKNLNNVVELKNKISLSFIKGAKVDVSGRQILEYRNQFINRATNSVVYDGYVKTDGQNSWFSKPNFEYYIDWKVKVFENDKFIFEHDFNPIGKRVYIAFESKSLGDTLAWIPAVEAFKKKHKCDVVVSTFHNYLFKDQYPDIEFVEPGVTVYNLYAMYSIGLFYNEDNTPNGFLHPNNFMKQPLQKIAYDILGLPYIETKPRLPISDIQKDDKLITIAIHGTSQCKYWNNPTGWQEVVDWLNERGYTVKLLSEERSGYMGNHHPKGIIQHPAGNLESVMNELRKSKAFIGIGSGLSWISWALGVKTVLISGFSYEWAEMRDCVRIGAPVGKCSGCFNRVRLDAGNWNWCPDHEGTDRQFECSKLITGNMVIKELEKFL